MAPAPQQPGQGDNSAAILWAIGAIFVAGALIWYTLKKQIISTYFFLKLWEIKFLSYFTHSLDDVQAVILSTDPNSINFTDVVNVGQAVGSYLRFPLVVLLLIFAFLVFFNNSARVFKRNYSMKELVELEKENWPQINPVAKLDLVNTDIDKGPWAMAMTPMQFCKRHRLLEIHKKQPKEGMSYKERNVLEVTLKRGLANKIFALQLGPLWSGIFNVPPHIRALFVVFAARHLNETQIALDLLTQFNISSATKLNFSGIDELAKKYTENKQIKKIMDSHAYMLTVMASMLNAARDDGVQASADFLWLKPVDRRLWYMLNNVGRQTAFVEVAGPFSHWVAEKEIGRAILIPMVEQATNALEITLREIVYQPDEGE